MERSMPIDRIVPVGLDARGRKEADGVGEEAKLARLGWRASWCAAVREALWTHRGNPCARGPGFRKPCSMNARENQREGCR